MKSKIAIIDGLRIPFQPSRGIYKNLMAYDLCKHTFSKLLERNENIKDKIDYVNVGTVIQEVKTSNIARECAIGVGLSDKISSHTISQACISSSQAVANGAEKILTGQSNFVLSGGVETFSDVPIRYSKNMRSWLMDLPKESKKGMINTIKYANKLRLKDLKPEPPAIANFTTGEVMGVTSEKIAKRFNVTREEQDAFSLRSHQMATDAHNRGDYENEICEYQGTKFEKGIRTNLQIQDLNKLKPSFDKKNGTHTAGNSSPLTDGSTACILSSIEKAKELEVKPLSFLKSWVFSATDPREEMLLGPAYAIPKLLLQNNLTLNDIDVFEIHEAFAGQILANLKALDSDKFCLDNFNKNKFGEIPFDKLNLWGGSIAIGHPLGASNIRNIITASNRLRKEDGKLALIAACADGGLATAMLIERN